eukprot:XP_001694304.1 alpha-amylase-like protein [Chlamydomonas reinhardtii]
MPPPPPTSVPFLQLTTCRLAASAPTSPQTSHTPLNSHTHVTMALGMHAQQQQHRLQARTANRRTAAAPLRPAQPANAAASRSRAQRGFAWDSWQKGGGNWYGRVQAAIPELAALQVSHVWLPPPSRSVSKEGYLPGQLYDLDSEYGTKEQLTQLCAALKAAGISPMADIVINHRANDPHFNGEGNPDTGDDFGAAPDLDHANPELRAALVDWLKHLKTEVGFTGWRFDYARGYAARFIAEYVDKTVGKDVLNVGEYWTEQWQGKAPGLVGWWPAKAVTFIENHDTGSTQQHWPFPSEYVGTGYAYLLTHPGIPTIFWDHVFEWGEPLRQEITALAQLRQRVGLHSESKLEILAAEPDMYVARVAEKVTVKLGPRCDMGDLLPKEDDGWKFVMSGKDWAVWEKTN